ncbi:MAG TPA: hypothetical protein VJ279_09145 [Hanamia sp.]|jgi:hypothetical protein|nr:hypothetical protein [Hanamia sp.]
MAQETIALFLRLILAPTWGFVFLTSYDWTLRIRSYGISKYFYQAAV